MSKEQELILKGTPDMILEAIRTTVEEHNSQESSFVYAFRRTSGAPDYARWDKTYFATCTVKASTREGAPMGMGFIAVTKPELQLGLQLLPEERTLLKIMPHESWSVLFEPFLDRLTSTFQKLGFMGKTQGTLATPEAVEIGTSKGSAEGQRKTKGELEQFRDGLVRYKKIVLAEKRGRVATDFGNLYEQETEFQKLSSELQESYGRLKAIIEEYGGSTDVLLMGGNYKCEAFTAAFTPTIFERTAFSAVMDTAIAAVNIAIGNLGKLPLPEVGQVQAPQEAVFPSGKPYAAYKAIMDILTAATKEVIIVDPYVDSTLFTRLENVQPNVQIQILTKKMERDFQLAGQKFKEQREENQQGKLQIRKTGRLHDRFIFTDEKIFHIGASLKDAGTKLCAMSEFEGEDIKKTLRKTISGYWDEAEIVL